ncbi:LysM peptidoglycan-binding domain-containing protein [Pseudomonas seleniipraecipitans]|uniref:LysM peptidoglycan-binding domain-containing protein n=1 Tax=Phytopseudomonas seleniipraecipitans TaxID=640205 RepID=A0ABY5J9R0_9GAMM|nr:LysM peptidoglycan-binding domain-containing protein [Pseudomonas seleniipraecipitans]
METINHLVQPGETLSKIAGRYGSSVGQLRQLNRFISGQRPHSGRLEPECAWLCHGQPAYSGASTGTRSG